jgi:glutamate--cysteine ligase
LYNFPTLRSKVEAYLKKGISTRIPYINRGLEKESLRQTSNGKLAQTPHPHTVGSALTNEYITTDYSEALLEFITPVLKESDCLINFLQDLHSFTLTNMDPDESLWCHSMPCILTEEKEIQIANYGTSNIGQMKHIYRQGLDWRYTKKMQTIAGIHFNFSYPEELWEFLHQQSNSPLSLKDFKSEGYFKLIRNFQRYVWLLFYFTGSSPALCKSFLSDQENNLESFDECTAYLPFATSLRMSDLGYTNKEQQALNVSFNSLDEYVDGLTEAIKTPSQEFAKIGTKVNGVYRQLNANILQIENEFYSIVRPKRTISSGEKPSKALSERGVEYVEIRMLDINPFEPAGISEESINFLDIFMLSCLLEESPAVTTDELAYMQENQQKAILSGREKNLTLKTSEGEKLFNSLAEECLESFKSTAELLDKSLSTKRYSETLARHKKMLDNPDLSPSGRIIQEMEKGHCSYYPFAKKISDQHNQLFKKQSLSPEMLKLLQESVSKSHQKQREIEQSDTISFDDFLNNYFNQ